MCTQVVDLISLKPFDMETIAKSVRKTRKVIIVEECMKTGAALACPMAPCWGMLYGPWPCCDQEGLNSKMLHDVPLSLFTQL